jgi:mono/diheme cytochrome c family protein
MRAVPGSLFLACFLGVAGVATAQDAKVQQGMKVYESTKCGMCHSIAGKGNKKFPLDGVGSKLTPAQIKEWIVDPKSAAQKAKSEAKPPMPSYAGKLSDADVDALVAYLASLK